MREILFRGKRIFDEQWVYGTMYKIATDLNPFILTGGKCGCSYQVDEETVGQYTGLNDKNGKRIFDGDVVKVLQGKDKGIAYVGFENGAFMLYPRTGNIYERTLWEYWYNDWDVEVIGNITDNPELLEK